MVYCLTNGAFGLKIMQIYSFCQRVYMRKQSSTLMSRSKNEAWFTWRSTVRSNSIAQTFLNDVRNSFSSFIAQRSSTLQKIHLK